MKKTLLFVFAALLGGAVAQAQITEFPYTLDFENGLDGWTTVDSDDDGFDWTVSLSASFGLTAHSGTHIISSASYDNDYGDPLYPDNWLISPAITLGDGEMELQWWHYTQDANYPAEHYAVYVSTSGNTPADFTGTPLFEVTMTAADHVWTPKSVSLADYAGQTVYIAFRHFNCTDMFYLHLDDISILEAGAPIVTLSGDAVAMVGEDATIEAHVTGGDGSPVTITWSSLMATAGNATLTPNDSVLTINYSAAGTDTVTCTVANGSASVSSKKVITVVDCPTITEFPWTEDFNNPTTSLCWRNNGWSRLNFTGDTVNTFMGVRGNDNGLDAWVISPAIALPAEGSFALDFDYYGLLNGYYAMTNPDLEVRISTTGYDTASFATLLLHLTNTSNAFENHVISLADYAGETVRIAFVSHCNDSYYYTLFDNVKVRNSSAPVVVLPATTAMTDANTPTTYAATIVEGDLNGIFYTWTSTMEAAGNATMTPADSVLEITYTTGGEDTLTVVAANSYGTDTAVMYVHVRNCMPIDSLPWTESFDNQNGLECWTVLDVDGNGTSWNYDPEGYIHSPYSSAGPDNWVITPAIVIPDEDAESLILAWSVRGDEYTVDNHYQVLVSPTAGTTDTAFTDTLVDESHPEGVWVNRTVSVAQYAGQTVRFAFRHVNTGDDDGMDIDNVCVRNSLAPVIEASAPVIADVNVPVTAVAILQEGSHEELYYTWTSTMEVAGNATLVATEDTAIITYTATGRDTLTVVATNAYGTDSVVMYVTVRDLNPVAEFPYTTGFEEADSADNASWYFANSSNGWYIDSATANTGSQSLYISSDNGATNNYGITASSASYAYRAINFAAAGDYAFSFDWKAQGESTYDYIRAFLVPSSVAFVAGDNTGIATTSLPTGYVALDGGSKLNLDSNWNTQNAVVPIATPGVYLLTFYWRNDYSQGTQPPAAIDNVTVAPLSCSTPGDIVFDNITSDSLEFHWTPRGEETSWEVCINQNVVVVTDSFYVAEGLQANTNYNVSVRAICGEGDSSFAVSVAVRTACSDVELPYTEDFENGGEQCWNILNYYTTSSSTGVTTSTYATSGTKVLRMYPGYNYQPVFAVMPRVSDLSDKMLVFNACGSSYITLQVGTMASPIDTTTFVPLYSVMSGFSLTMAEHEVYFNGDTTGNEYIAFRVGVNSSYGYSFYLDDVTVMVAPSCAKPTAIAISSIEADGATLTITDTANLGNYSVVVLTGTDTVVDAIATSDVYSITGLEANTNYTVVVKGICGDGTTTMSLTATFRTACTGGNCEFTVDMADSYGDGWNGNAINVMQNGQLYESLTITSGNSNTVTVAPCLGDPVVLLWQTGNYAYETSFSISNAAGENILAMDGDDLYSGDTLVVFDGNCGVSYVIGDTVPGPGPQPDTCIAPTNLRVLSTTKTNATIDWTPGASEAQWQIELNGNVQNNVAVAHPYVLNGLAAGTQYRVRVRAVCGANMFSEWTDTLVFTTATDTTGIVSAETIGFGLYPNPAVDKVNVDFDGVALISILDLNGRELIRTDEKTIDIEGLAKGTYFVRLTSQEGTAVRKLVIR